MGRTLLLFGCLFCVACVDTVGPFVRDIQRLPSGELRVTKCTIEFHTNGFSRPTLEDGECRSEIK
jgi:hypothetical protein